MVKVPKNIINLERVLQCPIHNRRHTTTNRWHTTNNSWHTTKQTTQNRQTKQQNKQQITDDTQQNKQQTAQNKTDRQYTNRQHYKIKNNNKQENAPAEHKRYRIKKRWVQKLELKDKKFCFPLMSTGRVFHRNGSRYDYLMFSGNNVLFSLLLAQEHRARNWKLIQVHSYVTGQRSSERYEGVLQSNWTISDIEV